MRHYIAARARGKLGKHAATGAADELVARLASSNDSYLEHMKEQQKKLKALLESL